MEIPDEVLEIIFSHLNGKDVKKAMLVSSKWNEIISRSAKCLKKLKLTMTDTKDQFVKDSQKLLRSTRKYQNISIHDGKENMELIYKIVNAKKSLTFLKSVEIHNTKFRDPSKFLKFIEVFEPSVEHLSLHGVTIEKSKDYDIDFEFENLKSVQICYCDQSIFLNILINCANLESLSIGNSKVKPSDPSDIISMLQRCKNLKQLHLNTETFSEIFSTDISEMPFNLVDLSVLNYGIKIDIEKTSENFRKFLQAQSKSIKKIHLGDFFGIKILKFVFGMKSLKSLKMLHLPLIRWEPMILKPSATIETLDIITSSTVNKERIKCLLYAVPKAKLLKLQSVNEEIAQFIKQNLKEVESIKICDSQRNKEFLRKFLPNVKIA